MAAGIATGFVRKLYRILDLESDAVISWDASGASFSIHDADALNANVLPKYFRGRLCAFRQQLVDHGFEHLECEDNETREVYRHEHFVKGQPAQLSLIARVPKPKRRAQQQQQQPVTVTIGNNSANSANANGMAAMLQVKQPPSRSLTVTLNTGVKRPSPSASQNQQQKRMRAGTEQQHQQEQLSLMVMAKLNSSNNNRTAMNSTTNSNINSNPLFSNEPDSSALSFARLAESGLLPHSSDLPEPISYLAKSFQSNANSNNSHNGTMPAQAATQAYTRVSDPPMFSDDLFRSAIIFLTSTSTTGVEPPSGTANATNSATSSNGSVDKNGNMTVPSNLLSMLLASSTSGMFPGSSTNGSWGGSSAVSSNPLFSDQSTGDDDEDQDSIWNLLVASSVDRVKSAIGDLETPQERLKVILAERERLEEQRKKFSRANNTINIGTGVRTSPSGTNTAAPKKNTTNPLFAKTTPAPATTTGSSNPLFTKTETKSPLFAKASSVFSQNPLFAKPASKPTTAANTSQPQNSNPLFAKSTKAPSVSNSNTLVLGGHGGASASAGATGAAVGGAPNEDDLWRLLMSSSIDSFRRIGEFEV